MTRRTIDKLLREFPSASIRAGFVRSWLDSNRDALSYLEKDGPTSRILDGAEPREAAQIATQLEQTCPTLKDLEAAFEGLIDAARRKKQGAIYTPDHIIDYLITESMTEPTSGKPLLLDPACGSGGFLARGAHHFSKHRQVPYARALVEHVAGIDNDPDAIDHARCLLELHAAARRESIHQGDLRLACMDTLLTPPAELLHAIGSPAGVQVLATNPPYVKLQTLSPEYRKQLTKRYPAVSQYNFSLALLFLVAGRELLAADGTLAYITQNNLFNSLAAESVRELLQKAQCLRRVVDFGHHRVFQDVLAYTCLIFVDRKQHPAIQFERIERDVGLGELRNLNFEGVPIASLKPKKWRVAKPAHLRNLKRIENTGEPLGHIAEIKVGFATLKDKVFFVSAPNLPCVAIHPETGREYEIEPAITCEAIRVADVREQSDLDSATRRIILPYRRLHGRFVLIPEDRLQAEYPLSFIYLNACRSLLESRDKGRKSYEAWYAWGRTQSRDAPGPKLLTKTFNTRPRFFYDRTDRLFCNGYSIRIPGSALFGAAIRLDALQVILQSRVMHYYAKLTAFQIDGDFQCYQKNFIERFGIPSLKGGRQQQLVDADRETADALLSDIYGLTREDIDEILGPPNSDTPPPM